MSECDARIHDLVESPKEWSPRWGGALKSLRLLFAVVKEWPHRRPISPREACRKARLGALPKYHDAHVVILIPAKHSWFPIFVLPDGHLDVHPEIWKLLPKESREELKGTV